jgi:hypothetical protein
MYGQLPSYVKDNATLYDLKVTETLIGHENAQYEEIKTGPKKINLTENEMKKMLAKVKQ